MPMRISRTTVVLLLANLIAFGLVWRAMSGQTTAAVSQTQLFPANPARIALAEGPARVLLEKRPAGWRVLEPKVALQGFTVRALQLRGANRCTGGRRRGEHAAPGTRGHCGGH